MNKLVVLIFMFTLTLVFFMIAYLLPFVHGKKIKKGKFDLFQFINLFFAPLLIIPIFYYVRKLILANDVVEILHYPDALGEIIFLILIYLVVLGNGIHSVSVVLSKHMKDLRKHKVWEINEFFHHHFSHILLTAPTILILVAMIIIEINRPNALMLSTLEIVLILISGVIIGVILGIASIEGSIAHPMFIICYGSSLLVPLLFFWYNLDVRFFPLSIFGETLLITSVLTLSSYRYKRNGFPEIVPQHFFDE